MKSASTAFFLWLACIFGICGLHRFYVGRPVTGLIWLLTLGLLGVGQLFDLFFLRSMVRQANMLNGLYRQGDNVNTATVNNNVAPVINVAVNLPAGATEAIRGTTVELPELPTSRPSAPLIERH